MKSLIYGTFAIDDIDLPQVKLEKTIGGAASYASLASSLFNPTIVAGMAGRDFPVDFIQSLKTRGIDTEFVEYSKELDSFRWKAFYSEDLNSLTTTYQSMNAAANLDATNVASIAKNCKTVFLSNLDPTIQLNLIKQIPSQVIKMLDSMDLWIVEKRDELKKVLKYVDIYFVSEDEASLLIGKKMPIQDLISEVMALGPQVVVLKKGRFGLSMYGAMGTLSMPSFPLTHVVDPSGAGDSLGGAVAGVLARMGKLTSQSMATALLLGSVVSSFVVEGYTLEPLMSLTLDEIINRAKLFMSELPNSNNVLLDSF